MGTASPRVRLFLRSLCGPLVSARQFGFEQRSAARAAVTRITSSTKTSVMVPSSVDGVSGGRARLRFIRGARERVVLLLEALDEHAVMEGAQRRLYCRSHRGCLSHNTGTSLFQ